MESGLDYREVLRRELERRCGRNPAYSLRALARDLDLTPSRLSEILSGKSGLSPRGAEKVAAGLGFTATEAEVFVNQVRAHHSKSPWIRERARRALDTLDGKPETKTLDLDRFNQVADWHHGAIVELIGGRDAGGMSASEIARRLGVNPNVARSAIQRLMRLGVLEKKPGGGWKRATESLHATPTDVPSDAIKRHHDQVLDRAKRALFEQPVAARDFSTLTLLVDSARIEEAKRLIRDFRREFNHRMKPSPDAGDRVYALAIQFFGLDQQQQKKKRK